MSRKQYAFLSELPTKMSQLEIDVELTENPKVTLATLYASNWLNNTQVVMIEGISADESQQAIHVNPLNNTENLETIADCNIIAISQNENTLTFSCETVPTKDVQFYIEWEDVNYLGEIN